MKLYGGTTAVLLSVAASFLACGGRLSDAVLINNGVDGDPEVECGSESITVNINTINPFEGHIFVKPLFITKVDKAYNVQCFYMEADKTVEAEQMLAVSILPTETITQGVPMPVCRYEILEEGPAGEPILFAAVGDPVYHKWTCDSETIDTFCMVVRDCFVDDKQGAKVDLINTFGCAEDRFLLSNPEYPSDLMAGVQTHVFKYADRPVLAFQCQISIFVKEPSMQCPRPFCAEPGGRGAGSENIGEGPPPPAPDHPFPLGPGSPYSADPNAVAPNLDPIPIPLDGFATLKLRPKHPNSASHDRSSSTTYGEPPPPPPTAFNTDGYIAKPPPPPQAQPQYDQANGRYRNDRYRNERYFLTKRHRRNVLPALEAGVLDVRTELNAIQMQQESENLSSASFIRSHPEDHLDSYRRRIRSRSKKDSNRYCFTGPTVSILIIVSASLLFAAIGFSSCLILKSTKL